MKLSFDYYHNLEKIDFFLCNPDGRELYPLLARDRRVVLRYNDLSELTFLVDDKYTDREGKDHACEAYDYLRTKRLVFATGIGWFRISKVDEQDDGINKHKAITAESLQAALNDKGFLSEERPYAFYNPADPYDIQYEASADGAIPSVLGQLYRQLGIQQDLSQGRQEPSTPYPDWTVTYVSASLRNLHRTFKENITFGYDWIANEVENAFEAVVHFDILNKAIHVLTVAEVAANKAGVIYTFRNFMKNVNVVENSDDVVTVLNCYGNNCDITMVNPTGTNYICDFSYYMDEVEHRWMSDPLIAKLKAWRAACESKRPTYVSLVGQYRAACEARLDLDTDLRYASTYLTELKNASNNRSVLGEKEPGELCGVVRAEGVNVGEYSLDVNADFETVRFNGSSRITAYANKPTYVPVKDEATGVARHGVWVFSGEKMTGTADAIVAQNLSRDNGTQYWYFTDSNGLSYCKLKGSSKVNKETSVTTYECSGFDRYIAMLFPVVEEKTEITNEGTENEKRTTKKITKYIDFVQSWIDLHESRVSDLNSNIVVTDSRMEILLTSIKAISDSLNIISYFSNTPSLLRELNCYWCEGEFDNNNIAVLDTTTYAEEIDLANELMAAGYNELSRVSQPRFSFSLDAIDATKNYEFRSQMQELELGRVITIEKAEGLWYYPVLLELSMSLDDTDDFAMTFANALRLDDWGYTYADLIKSAVSTSRQVGANWQNIIKYVKDRDKIQSVIEDPLDLTLRAATANMKNQEFSIDSTGILGRKKVGEASNEFEPEQVRLINNVLIFTDDNWKTLKTALGKISMPDPDDSSKTITRYGIAGEVVVGKLMISNALQIHNEDSSIIIDQNGIFVRRVPSIGNDKEDIIFSVDTSGNLTLQGYATLEEVEGEFQKTEASIKTLSDGNQATFEALTSFQKEVEDEFIATNASVKTVSDAHGATASMVADFKSETTTKFGTIDDEIDGIESDIDGINKEITSVKTAHSDFIAEANETYAKASMVADFKSETTTKFGTIDDEIDKVEKSVKEAGAAIDAIAGEQESLITLTANYKTYEGKVDSLEDSLTEISSSVADIRVKANENGAGITSLTTWKGTADGKISDLEDGLSSTNTNLAKVEQTANANGASIGLVVQNGSVRGSILVEAINGQTTAKISADVLDIEGKELNIKVDAANITGALTIGQLPDTIAQKNEIPSKLSQLTNDSGYQNASGVTTIVNGVVTTDFVEALGITVDAAKITGTLTIGQLPSNVAQTNQIPVYTSQLVNNSGYATESGVTTIVKGVVTTDYVNALGISVNAANVTGTLAVGNMPTSVAYKSEIPQYTSQLVNNSGFATESGITTIVEGVVTTDYVNALGITVDAAHITGTLAVGRMPLTVAYKDDIPQYTSQLTNNSGYATESGVTTIVKGVVTTDYVNALGITVDAANITGTLAVGRMPSTVAYKSEIPTEEKITTITNNSIQTTTVTAQNLKVNAANVIGVVTASSFFATQTTPNGVSATCFLSPASEGLKFTEILGPRTLDVLYGLDGIWAGTNSAFGDYPILEIAPAAPAGTLHGTWSTDSGTISTSDRNKKNAIEEQTEVYSRIFDRLIPVTFKYNNGTSDRTHLGLIAQDVEDAVLAEGITTKEFAPVAYDVDENGNKTNYGIRYEELVSLCIYEIQRLKTELKLLKEQKE